MNRPDLGRALVVIPSHGTHRVNVIRMLNGLIEFDGYKVVFVSRTFAPIFLIKLRNWIRSQLHSKSDTVVVSRGSENLVVDGFTQRIVRWNASQIKKFAGDVRVVVFGETGGEVLMLAEYLSSLTGASTCFVPEGLGVLSQTKSEFEAGGSDWRAALRKASLRPRLGQLTARSIGKFFWRLRRFVFLVLTRPVAPRLSIAGRFDYLVSDWLRDLPDGFDAGKSLAPRVSVFAENSAARAVFLHGPYDFEEVTWTACLRALDLAEIDTLVIKQHRNPLGFGALEAAARKLDFPPKIEFIIGGNIEDYFSQETYALVAGIDSSALFSARQLLPESRVVSTLDTLVRCSSSRDRALVHRYRKEFELFRAQCPSNIAFV